MKSMQTIIIATGIGGASGRDCLSGIFRFLNEGVDWRIHLLDNPQKLTAEAVALADGLITETSVPPSVMEEIEKRRMPVVFTNYDPDCSLDNANAEFLSLDDTHIGEEAFRFFARLGNFASFVFITDSAGSKWSDARERGFCRAAMQFRKKPLILDMGASGSNERDDHAIALKLKRLPKPIAVFAAWDVVSVRVLGICDSAKIDVPGKVAILGVDNDEILCCGVTPTLSSVQPNHESLGYTAGKELRRLLMGGRGGGRYVVLRNSVREILKRGSTRIVQPAEHLIQSAKDFIEQHASENITPKDVVQHIGVSRALADLRFRELNGKTIRQEIAAARIGEIKKRLMSSQNTISEIARSCGFSGAPALSRYFMRETGERPSVWRAR